MTNVVAALAKVHALQGRVNELRGELEKFERYAESCQRAASQLRGPLDALSGLAIDVGGMQSRSIRINRARAIAGDVRADVRTARTKVQAAVGDLRQIGQKYDRKATAVRGKLRTAEADLRAAQSELALVPF